MTHTDRSVYNKLKYYLSGFSAEKGKFIMDLKKLFGYEGKKVFITGSASGMSKAATELLLDLGAEVYAVDLNPIALPVKQAFQANLANKDEIDAVLAQLPDELDCLFLCHGIATHPGNEILVEKVNFLSQKYITEALLPRVKDNGSVTFISSFGGSGWEKVLPQVGELLDAATWEDALDWYAAHPKYYDTKLSSSADYVFTKQCLNAYVVSKCHAPEFISRKIRLNSICPGDTLTGLSEEFYQSVSTDGTTDSGKANVEGIFLKSWNGRPATSEEMGYPLVCVGSDIFSYTSGQNIFIDYGLASSYTNMALKGQFNTTYDQAGKNTK